tara:strand:- start:321 stop:569 length:249 start_codon:yes stop_codon:yes gene_type:complete
MASVKTKLYDRIMDLQNDMMLIELDEYEGPMSSDKVYKTYDRLTAKYEDKYGNPGTFNKGGLTKKKYVNPVKIVDNLRKKKK